MTFWLWCTPESLIVILLIVHCKTCAIVIGWLKATYLLIYYAELGLGKLATGQTSKYRCIFKSIQTEYLFTREGGNHFTLSWLLQTVSQRG